MNQQLSDVSYVSTAQKSLVNTNGELNSLINRVNYLSKENVKYEVKNDLTQKKMKQILETKKGAYEDKIQLKIVNEKLADQRCYMHAKIQQFREDQTSELQQILQKLQEDKLIKSSEIKKIKEEAEQKIHIHKQMEFKRKKELAQFVNLQQRKQRENVQFFWDERMKSLKSEQNSMKNKLIFQKQMQEQAIFELGKIELDLLNKLKSTQQLNKDLVDQLEQVKQFSHMDYESINIPIQDENESNQEIQKQLKYLSSPYAQNFAKSSQSKYSNEQLDQQDESMQKANVNISKLKMIQSLPYLQKPSFSVQQQSITRLYNSKKGFNQKMILLSEQILHDQLEKTKIKPINLTKPKKKQNQKDKFINKTRRSNEEAKTNESFEGNNPDEEDYEVNQEEEEQEYQQNYEQEHQNDDEVDNQRFEQQNEETNKSQIKKNQSINKNQQNSKISTSQDKIKQNRQSVDKDEYSQDEDQKNEFKEQEQEQQHQKQSDNEYNKEDFDDNDNQQQQQQEEEEEYQEEQYEDEQEEEEYEEEEQEEEIA